MRLMKESFIIIAICAFDLVLTLFLITEHHASEGNPLMAFYLQFGIGAFILAKVALSVGPVVIAEWSKQYRPRFVRNMMRITIAAYVVAYLLLFLGINVPTMAADVPPR